MLNPLDNAAEIKNYLKKLANIISNQPGLLLIQTKVIKKMLIDDILCCIEANFTEEYKNFTKKTKGKRLKSYYYYNELILAIRNKFLLNPSCYSVYYKEALRYIDLVSSTIDSDMNLVYSEESRML